MTNVFQDMGWDTESEELISNDINWTSPFSVPKRTRVVAK